jgi:hypothetical protein
MDWASRVSRSGIGAAGPRGYGDGRSSVLAWLALSYIVWCIRNGERLFRWRGF